MGIYYAAVDIKTKEIIHPPKDFANKYPGVFYITNPFSGMVLMKNSFGCNFELVNDTLNHDIFYMEGLKDITNEVFEQYLLNIVKLTKESFNIKRIEINQKDRTLENNLEIQETN